MSDQQNAPLSAAAVTRAKSTRATAPNNAVIATFDDGIHGAQFASDELQTMLSKDGKTLTMSGEIKYSLKQYDNGDAPHDGFGTLQSVKLVKKYFDPEWERKRAEAKSNEKWKKFATLFKKDLTAKEMVSYIEGDNDDTRWLFLTFDRKRVEFSKRAYNAQIDKNLWIPPITFAELPEATQAVLISHRDGALKRANKAVPMSESDIVAQRANIRKALQGMPEDNPMRAALLIALQALDAQSERLKATADREKAKEAKLEQEFVQATANGDEKKIEKLRKQLKDRVAKFEKASENEE